MGDLDAIREIIASCTYYINNLEAYNRSSELEKKVIHTYPYLILSLNSMWSLAIVDLCKVLSKRKNDAYRLRAFINYLHNSYKSIKWKNPITKDQLNGHLLEIEHKEEMIRDLKTLRDEQIAHSGRDIEIKFVSLEIVKPLLHLCQEIFNELSFSIAGSTTCWRYSDYDLISPLIESLVKFQEIEELTFQNLKKHQNKIDTDEILKIIRANS